MASLPLSPVDGSTPAADEHATPALTAIIKASRGPRASTTKVYGPAAVVKVKLS
jgi:hypothetical protein